LSDVLFFSLAAALNPTLLTATTVMLLLPSPRRLLLGYLLGALTTGITVGLVVVNWLGRSNAVSTTKREADPALDIMFGLLFLVVAIVVGTGSWGRRRERKRQRAPNVPKKVPRWQATLSEGTARTTFVIGLLLSFPGASYLAALTSIYKQSLDGWEIVVSVVVVNLIMLVLLELPLIAYTVAPDWTPTAIESLRAWISRHAQRAIVVCTSIIGVALIARGVITIVTG
jgi:hypothetical protein